MIDREEHQLILDVAVRYYLEDKTQSQIAKELFISRSKVSRLLKKARSNRIVEININYESEEFELLKAQVNRMFGIKNLFITKSVKDELATLKEVCKTAARELELYLHDDITFGISWGRHIGMLSRYLIERDYQGIEIVEMFGALSYNVNQVDTLSVGRKVCDKLNAKLYPMPAPIYMFDPMGRAELMASSAIKNALDKIDECDLILTSIGTVENDILQTLWHNYLKDDMKQEVRKNNGAGFILAHFFNQNGEFFDSIINESVIGIKTEKIKDKKIFAIASGTKKATGILAALRGGFLDTLVTDELTIRQVIGLATDEERQR